MPLQKLPGSPADTPEVDVAEAARVWSESSAQLVDVREPDEWEAGRIPGSIHIPLSELGQRADELVSEVPVVVVCAAGVRSLAGAESLLTRGFHDVASLNGGIIAWAEAGLPVES
jgi:rhodanese-related sulfurtransferase